MSKIHGRWKTHQKERRATFADTIPPLLQSMSEVDVVAVRLAETTDLVAKGLDPNIAVAATESFGVYPHDSHHRGIRSLAGMCGMVGYSMEMKQTVLITKAVDMYPRGEDGQRDLSRTPYTFRFLQVADHVDYDDGQRLWVSGIVAQMQGMYPANGSQWGETYPLAGPRVSATQVEFEDGVRDMVSVLGRPDSGRLHVLVSNFHTARQATVEQASREKVLTAKALEEEKASVEKLTPTFAEHELIELIDEVQKRTGYQVFPMQIANVVFATQLYYFVGLIRSP